MAVVVYRDPLRSVSNLVPERVDMGVDYSGIGPLYAIGPGVITNVYNSGWPGGTFIGERLTAGPYAGKYVYAAEDIAPSVSVGQKVTANTVIGRLYGGPEGIELGFAAKPGTGTTMAAAAGQAASGPDPGARPTAYGEAFNKFLQSLGAPAGILNGQPTGTANIQTTSITGDIIGAIANALGLGANLKDFFIRGGLIILGGILLVAGLVMMGKGDQSSNVNITGLAPLGKSKPSPSSAATEAEAAAPEATEAAVIA
jgi:hypothetical protein